MTTNFDCDPKEPSSIKCRHCGPLIQEYGPRACEGIGNIYLFNGSPVFRSYTYAGEEFRLAPFGRLTLSAVLHRFPLVGEQHVESFADEISETYEEILITPMDHIGAIHHGAKHAGLVVCNSDSQWERGLLAYHEWLEFERNNPAKLALIPEQEAEEEQHSENVRAIIAEWREDWLRRLNNRS